MCIVTRKLTVSSYSTGTCRALTCTHVVACVNMRVCVSLIISALTFCRLEEEKRQLQREYDHLPKKEVKEKERGERKRERKRFMFI